MKVNGNNTNKHQPGSNESKTDQLSKQAVEVVDGIPVKNFNPAKTWLKISARLGQIDKRFVTWGIAMAASFSMLIAANLGQFDWLEINDKPAEKEVVTIPANTIETKTSMASNPISLSAMNPVVPEISHPTIVSAPIADQLPTKQLPVLKPSEKSTKEMAGIKPFANPFVSGFVKANIQSIGVSPEIGIDFKLAENYTARRREIYKLGVSSQFNFSSDDEGRNHTHTHFFVNLEYTTLNKKTNKGWTARSGYLINPDGQLYQDTTIKVSLFRNIGKNLKVGPEVIFTNNLTKPYPAISLVLG